MTIGSKTVGSSSTGPYYKQKVWNGTDGKYNADGSLKYNPYTVDLINESRTPGASGIYACTYFGQTVPDVQWSALMESRLLGGLITSIKGHSFNLGVAVGEGKRTVSLVTDTLLRLGLTVRDLKHGHFEQAARRLGVRHRPSKLSTKDISGRFLELRYGWGPLIQDVYQAAKAYEVLTSGPRSHTYWSSHHARPDTVLKQTATSTKAWLKAELRGQYKAILLESLTTPRSLGLEDPLSVAWELLPYSFVIDWFIPIGNYLEQINTIPKLSGKYVKSVKRTWDGIYEQRNPTGTGAINAHRGAKCITRRIQITRTVSSSLSVPFPSFKSVDQALSPGHIWNAIALAHQRFSVK
jgi:hypothetical protein